MLKDLLDIMSEAIPGVIKERDSAKAQDRAKKEQMENARRRYDEEQHHTNKMSTEQQPQQEHSQQRHHDTARPPQGESRSGSSQSMRAEGVFKREKQD